MILRAKGRQKRNRLMSKIAKTQILSFYSWSVVVSRPLVETQKFPQGLPPGQVSFSCGLIPSFVKG